MSYERLLLCVSLFLKVARDWEEEMQSFVVTRCAGTNEGKILVHPAVVDFVFFIHWFAT